MHPSAHAPATARRPGLFFTFCLLGGLLLPLPAHGASRPFVVTESAVTLPPGGLRLEAGWSREDWDTGDKFYIVNPELTYNLRPNLDVEASIPWAVAGGRSPFKDGFGDMRARAKLRLARQRADFPVTLAGLLEIKFPTGIDPISTQQADLRLAGLATRDFGPVTLDGNLFYTFVGEGSGQSYRNAAGLSLGLEAPTSVDGLTGIGEFVWEQSKVTGRNSPIAFAAGGRYAVSPKLALDFGLMIGWGPGPLPGPGPRSYARGLGGTFGLTWNIAP